MHSTTSDAAAKERIISHMNADHTSSLSDYLQHYAHIQEPLAATAVLVDISLTQMTITTKSSPTGTTTTYIPIHPPMKSLDDARVKLVEMAYEAMAGLGKSRYVVDFYLPPKSFVQWAIVFGVILGFYSFSFASNFEEGAFVRDYLFFFAPGAAEFFKKWHMTFLILIGIVHGVEAIHMIKSRLRKHGTPPKSLVWWQWVIGTFLEGFGSFLRFDQAVAMVKAKGGH